MTTESSLQIDNTNTQPDISITEVDKSTGRYTEEDFRKELAKINSPQPEPEEIEQTPEEDVNEAEVENEAQTEESPEEDEDFGRGPIPKKRFNKEIEKRKAIEAELAREREARIRFETELSLYNKALDSLKEQQEEPKKASNEIDPVDEEAHRLYMKKIQELESKFENQTKSIAERQAQNEFEFTLKQQQEDFSKSNPDFQEAYKHVANNLLEKYKLLDMPEDQAIQYAVNELNGIAYKAFEVGKNVPSIFYNMAKYSGYSPNKAPTTKTGTNISNVEKNIKKSESIIRDVPEVTSSFAENSSILTSEGFEKRLMNPDGKGVNPDAFREALKKIQNNR